MIETSKKRKTSPKTSAALIKEEKNGNARAATTTTTTTTKTTTTATTSDSFGLDDSLARLCPLRSVSFRFHRLRPFSVTPTSRSFPFFSFHFSSSRNLALIPNSDHLFTEHLPIPTTQHFSFLFFSILWFQLCQDRFPFATRFSPITE